MERAIAEINDLKPDLVVCSGDLTTFGFKEEFAQAKRYLATIECEAVVVVPGNHDSRNVGYVHFEQLIGERSSVLRRDGITVVAVDSTEPDLDHGQIGRGRYGWIEEQFAAEESRLKVFVLHHHLLGAPWRAARKFPLSHRDHVLRTLASAGAELILGGHIHQATVGERREFEVVGDAAAHATVLAVAPGFGQPRPGRVGEARGLHVHEVGDDALTVSTYVWRERSWTLTAERRFPRRAAVLDAG